MAPTFAEQIGADTIQKLEAASDRRFREAEILNDNNGLNGAIYLYGYVAEMCLTASYFRLIGYSTKSEITRDDRILAVQNARDLNIMSLREHDILGWARFLVVTRKKKSKGFTSNMEREGVSAAQDLYSRWRPSLRDRAMAPAPGDVRAVQESAKWFLQNHGRLWG